MAQATCLSYLQTHDRKLVMGAVAKLLIAASENRRAALAANPTIADDLREWTIAREFCRLLLEATTHRA